MSLIGKVGSSKEPRNTIIKKALGSTVVVETTINVVVSSGNKKIKSEHKRKSTGMIVDSSGYVLATAHGVLPTAALFGEGFNEGLVGLFDVAGPGQYEYTQKEIVIVSDVAGNEQRANIVSIDQHNDLALLRVPRLLHEALTPVRFAKTWGNDHIFTLGNPDALDYVMREGTIARVRQKSKGKDLILLDLDMRVLQGDSGGPVILEDTGEVVGSIHGSYAIWGNGEAEETSLTFATPSTTILRFLKRELRKSGVEHFEFLG